MGAQNIPAPKTKVNKDRCFIPITCVGCGSLVRVCHGLGNYATDPDIRREPSSEFCGLWPLDCGMLLAWQTKTIPNVKSESRRRRLQSPKIRLPPGSSQA